MEKPKRRGMLLDLVLTNRGGLAEVVKGLGKPWLQSP